MDYVARKRVDSAAAKGGGPLAEPRHDSIREYDFGFAFNCIVHLAYNS
jgi:hypothetical protein